MKRRCRQRELIVRRAALLLELLIALAIFVAASALVLSSMRTVSTRLLVSRDQQQAVDLALSKLAELEAGLITVETLDGAEFETALAGSEDDASNFDESDLGPKHWRIEVSSETSRFTDLSIVTLRVFNQRPIGGDGSGDEVEACVLRQLVRLGGGADREEFDRDPLASMGGGGR